MPLNAKLRVMERVSRKLAWGDAWGALNVLYEVFPEGAAGHALHSLTQSEPDWKEKVDRALDQ